MADTGAIPSLKGPRARKLMASSAMSGAAAVAPAAEAAVASPIMVPEALLAPAAETIEAAPSPARTSDIISGPAADAAPTSEGSIDMATIPSPAEAAEKTQAMFGDVSDRVKVAFEKSTKLSEDMVDFSKGNVEAVMASARVAAKAAESLSQEAAEYSKRHFDAATAAMRSFATVKSPTELFQLQSEFAKSSFDSAVAEASKLSETMMKLASEITQPLSSRYALAAEKIKSASSL